MYNSWGHETEEQKTRKRKHEDSAKSDSKSAFDLPQPFKKSRPVWAERTKLQNDDKFRSLWLTFMQSVNGDKGVHDYVTHICAEVGENIQDKACVKRAKN